MKDRLVPACGMCYVVRICGVEPDSKLLFGCGTAEDAVLVKWKVRPAAAGENLGDLSGRVSTVKTLLWFSMWLSPANGPLIATTHRFAITRRFCAACAAF